MMALEMNAPTGGVDTAAVAVFESSLARCLESGGFIEAFYQRFIQSSPEVARKFERTDLTKQKEVLERSLHLMVRAARAYDDGLQHLERVAGSHSKRGLDILPSMYQLWLDSLIETVRHHDPQFHPRVESAWRTLLQSCIDRMIAVYRQEATVPPGVGPGAAGPAKQR